MKDKESDVVGCQVTCIPGRWTNHCRAMQSHGISGQRMARPRCAVKWRNLWTVMDDLCSAHTYRHTHSQGFLTHKYTDGTQVFTQCPANVLCFAGLEDSCGHHDAKPLDSFQPSLSRPLWRGAIQHPAMNRVCSNSYKIHLIWHGDWAQLAMIDMEFLCTGFPDIHVSSQSKIWMSYSIQFSHFLISSVIHISQTCLYCL